MKVHLSIILAMLACFSGLLLAPGLKPNFDWADFAAGCFGRMANAMNANANNVVAMMFGVLVGTLLTWFFDPAAKEQISRGIKGAWKRPSRF